MSREQVFRSGCPSGPRHAYHSGSSTSISSSVIGGPPAVPPAPPHAPSTMRAWFPQLSPNQHLYCHSGLVYGQLPTVPAGPSFYQAPPRHDTPSSYYTAAASGPSTSAAPCRPSPKRRRSPPRFPSSFGSGEPARSRSPPIRHLMHKRFDINDSEVVGPSTLSLSISRSPLPDFSSNLDSRRRQSRREVERGDDRRCKSRRSDSPPSSSSGPPPPVPFPPLPSSAQATAAPLLSDPPGELPSGSTALEKPYHATETSSSQSRSPAPSTTSSSATVSGSESTLDQADGKFEPLISIATTSKQPISLLDTSGKPLLPRWEAPLVSMDLSACPPIPLVTDEALLRVSRTHKSALLEDPAQFGVGPGEALKNELLSYKRMELEGDSILFNQVTINLLRKYKTLVTGSATAIRGTLCGNVTLAHFGRHYRLGEELILGPEARVLGLHLTPNTLADAFQARVAAVFRDFRRTGRLAEAERWLEDLFSPQVFPSLVAYVEIKRKEAIAHEFRATHGKGVDKNKKREKIYEDEADTQGRFGEAIQWRTRPPRRDS